MHLTDVRQTPAFAHLASRELAAVAVSARERVVRRGEPVFRAGTPCHDIPVLLSGAIRLYRPAADGGETTTGLVSAGELISVAALRGQARYDNHADALTTSRLIEVPLAVVIGLGERAPDVYLQIVSALAARRDRTFAGIMVQAEPDFLAKVFHALLALARPASPPAIHDDAVGPDRMRHLTVRLSHKELARLVGCDRASVTRALRILEERNVIQRQRGHIVGIVTARADRRSGGDVQHG